MRIQICIWFIMQLAGLSKFYSPGISSSVPWKLQRKHSSLKGSLGAAHSGGTRRQLSSEGRSCCSSSSYSAGNSERPVTSLVTSLGPWEPWELSK